jgi:branched-subunit amino acid transport protein AzlD
MYMIDVRWIIITICVVASGVTVALLPWLLNPILVAVAVGTLLYVVLCLGKPPNG